MSELRMFVTGPFSLSPLLEWNYRLLNLLNKVTGPHQKRNRHFLLWNSLVRANSIFLWQVLIWKSMVFHQHVRPCTLTSGQKPWRRQFLWKPCLGCHSWRSELARDHVPLLSVSLAPRSRDSDILGLHGLTQLLQRSLNA